MLLLVFFLHLLHLLLVVVALAPLLWVVVVFAPLLLVVDVFCPPLLRFLVAYVVFCCGCRLLVAPCFLVHSGGCPCPLLVRGDGCQREDEHSTTQGT